MVVSYDKAALKRISQSSLCRRSLTTVVEAMRNIAFFYWSLLGKVNKLSELPEIDAWSEYIGKLLLLGQPYLI